MDLGDQPCKDLVLESVDDDRRRVLTFELEAAEVLAGLARASYLGGEFQGRRNTQQNVAHEEATNAKQFCGNSDIMAAGSAVNNSKYIGMASFQTFGASHKSKVSSTSRQKLTEAEKEARRLRRVLANRESARQTIRRRQAMHLDLTVKAADLTEVNLYLMKEKEVAMKKCNSLKDENRYLKALVVAERKRSEPEQPNSPCAGTPRPAAAEAPFLSCNQPPPPVFPFFWTSHVPPLENVNSHPSIPACCVSGLPLLIPMSDEFCSKNGLNFSSAVSTQGSSPLFIMPIPWLLPFLTHHGMQVHGYSSMANNSQCSSSSIHPCPTCSDQNTSTSSAPRQGGSRVEYPQIHPTRATPAPKKRMHGCSLEKTRQRRLVCASRKSIDASAARWKRKEMLKLKNIHSHDAHLQ